MNQITTITFFRFAKLPDKLWGFSMMQFAHQHLHQVKGQSFYKLMGSGKGEGFNPWPDWSVYCLLQVWEREEDARQFFEQSAIIKNYRSHTSEVWTLYMKSISVKGAWSGGNPFHPTLTLDRENEYLAIITRATVKWKQLRNFWQYVPTSHKTLCENAGLIYTKGIGEVPIRQMATFSLWKNMDALKTFAYQSKGHRVAIEKTRQMNWFKEELFARFQPYLSVGTWGGAQLLPDLFVERI